MIDEETRKLFQEFDALNIDIKEKETRKNELREILAKFIAAHPDIEFQTDHFKYATSELLKYEHPEDIKQLEEILKEKKKQSILLGTSNVISQEITLRVTQLK